MLKLCTFCKGTPYEAKDDDGELTIECEDCGASMYKHYMDGEDYKYRCRKAWNSRDGWDE